MMKKLLIIMLLFLSTTIYGQKTLEKYDETWSIYSNDSDTSISDTTYVMRLLSYNIILKLNEYRDSLGLENIINTENLDLDAEEYLESYLIDTIPNYHYFEVCSEDEYLSDLLSKDLLKDKDVIKLLKNKKLTASISYMRRREYDYLLFAVSKHKKIVIPTLIIYE